MVAQDPQVALLAHGIIGRFRGRYLLGGLVIEQIVQLVQVEPGQFEVEVEALQRPQLIGQQVLVPAGVQGQAVVGDDVGPLLGLGQVGELDHRDRGHAQLAGRQESSVTGDDAGVAVDQDRVRPAELEQAGGDLGDLLGLWVRGFRS